VITPVNTQVAPYVATQYQNTKANNFDSRKSVSERKELR